MGESWEGDWVVREVDESCCAETVEDGLGGLKTLGGGSGEEMGEIYHLCIEWMVSQFALGVCIYIYERGI